MHKGCKILHCTIYRRKPATLSWANTQNFLVCKKTNKKNDKKLIKLDLIKILKIAL